MKKSKNLEPATDSRLSERGFHLFIQFATARRIVGFSPMRTIQPYTQSLGSTQSFCILGVSRLPDPYFSPLVIY